MRLLVAAFAMAAMVAVSAFAVANSGNYAVQVVMPNAANLLEGSRVQIGGTSVGEVTKLATRDGKALVTVSVDDEHAPLPAGTKAQVQWRGLLGERVVELLPGKGTEADIPNGSLVEAGTEQVELDQVLAALDPTTRAHVKSVVKQLDLSLKGRSDDVNATLASAGPAVKQLGEVLKAVGQDGPAIKQLITNLRKATEPVSQRQAELRSVINDLSSATAAMAAEQDQLSAALGKLPATLDSAKRPMDGVPGAVDSAAPLLDDLRPATDRLTSVAKNLSPLLVDLRPTIADLRPTLNSASTLLRSTPSLLDSAHAVVPGVTRAVSQLNPAVQFLRPYTPDVAGWISNWSAAFANYDAQGHYFHGLVQIGPNVLDDNPGAAVGLKGGPSSRPAPGMASGEPWTDANGSGPR